MKVAAEQNIGHIHHWMIGTQDGPASDAVCRTCGDKREFENAFRRAVSWKVRPAAVTQETDEVKSVGNVKIEPTEAGGEQDDHS